MSESALIVASNSSSGSLPSGTAGDKKPFVLRCRMKGHSGPVTIPIDDPETPLGLFLFMVEAHSGIPVEKLRLLSGVPPKEVSRDDETVAVTKLFRNGDVLVVQEGEAAVKQGFTDGRYIPPSQTTSYFARRKMPGDNSCLFHAAAYVLENKKRDMQHIMRQKCAECVAANKNFFTPAILGMPTEQYVRWISQTSSWGGEVELIVLSFLYQTEIVALDLQSFRVQRIGESSKYSTRVFLVYTGNHYDAIAVTPAAGGLERDDQVMFSTRDEKVFADATRFVQFERERKM